MGVSLIFLANAISIVLYCLMRGTGGTQSQYIGTVAEVGTLLTNNAYSWEATNEKHEESCREPITSVYASTANGGLGLNQADEAGTGYEQEGVYNRQLVFHPKRNSAQNICRGFNP